MEKLRERPDNFEERRKHLTNLTDAKLNERFWQLANSVVTPLIDIAKTHTSPAIERSVLLRMGFSSLEAKALVDKVIDHNLMGKGAGHVVYKLANIKELTIREAGLSLIEDKYWDDVMNAFRGVKS